MCSRGVNKRGAGGNCPPPSSFRKLLTPLFSIMFLKQFSTDCVEQFDMGILGSYSDTFFYFIPNNPKYENIICCLNIFGKTHAIRLAKIRIVLKLRPNKINLPLILGMLNYLMVGYKESATRSINILDLQLKLPMKGKQLPQSMNLILNMFQDLTTTELNYLLACLFVSSGVQAQRAKSPSCP